MSVLIKDMKMPRSCYNCKLDLRTDICSAFREWKKEHPYSIKGNDRLPNCPLVELPEKHGRLIDGDVLWDAMSKYNDNEGAEMPFGYDDTSIHIDSACFVIENAPTVIEAEGECGK